MKNFRVLSTFFAVALCVVVIESCSRNGDELDNSQNEKRISKMNVRIVQNDYVSIDNITFHYANGKLIKIKFYPSLAEMNITYSGKQVTYRENDSDGNSEEGVFQLNSEGFVESGSFTTHNEHSTFEYSNGYLTKIILKKNNPYPYNGEETGEIYYDDNGNILMTRNIWGGITRSYTFTVSNYPCKGKTLPFAFMGIGFLDMGGVFALYYCGLLGKEPKNLISSGTDSYPQSFNYTFDKDGYINTVIINTDDDEEIYTFSYE